MAAPQSLLLEGQAVRLFNPIVHTNLAAQPWSPVRHFILTTNAARSAWEPPVKLWKYAADTLVCGEATGVYVTISDGTIIAQQLGDWITDMEGLAAGALTRAPAAPRVADECLLVARQNDTVWGHWAYEMLPKIVLAEAHFPGRFRYVVPARVLGSSDSPMRQYVAAILSSLEAYGVGADRLLPISLTDALTFDSLFDMSGIWPLPSEEMNGLHSELIKLMNRQLKKPGEIVAPRRAFLVRPRDGRRRIANNDALVERARNHGFTEIDLSEWKLADQVRLFRDAELVAGVHGSGFAGALYAAKHSRVVTMAAAEWTDIYFVANFQKRRIRQADVRGRLVPGPWEMITQRDIYIQPEDFDEAVEATISDVHMRSDIGAVVIGDTMVPRALGELLFEIDFSRGGNATQFTRFGWSGPEERHRWSIGGRCRLDVPPGRVPQQYLWLTVTGNWIDDHMKTITAVVNGTRLDMQTIEGQCRLAWLVPKDVWTRFTPTRVEFEHPPGPSPKARGLSDDDRALGFCFRHIALAKLARTREP